jgi:hypothetical protein
VPALTPPLPHLQRVRWAVRATLTLGVAVSVAANILHAQHDHFAQAIAAWPPVALLLTVELISRVPVGRRVLAGLRLLATAAIAGIAAYVSYFHMAAVVARYGEHYPNQYLLPASVDGLVVVASVSLVELAGRLRAAERTSSTPALSPMSTGGPQVAAPLAPTVLASSATPSEPDQVDRPGAETGPATALQRVSAAVDGTAAAIEVVPHAVAVKAGQAGVSDSAVPQPAVEPIPVAVDALPPDTALVPDQRRAAHAARPVASSETTAAVAYWHEREPDLRPAEIANKIGRSERQVRRVLAALDADTAARTNGTAVPRLADSLTTS